MRPTRRSTTTSRSCARWSTAHPELYGSLFRQDVPALPGADVRALRAHRAEPRRGASTPTSASASPATPTRTRTSSSSTARRRSPSSSTPRSTRSSRPRATSTSPPRSRAGTRRRTRGSTGTSGWTSSTTRSSSTPRRTPSIEIVPLDFTTGANVLASNKGLAACLYFKTFARHVAAGRRRGLGPRPDAVPVRLRRQGLQASSSSTRSPVTP